MPEHGMAFNKSHKEASHSSEAESDQCYKEIHVLL